MLPTHERIAAYHGHEIYLRQPGFEFTPMLLGKIASCLVHGPRGEVASIAAMYSLLLLAGDQAPSEVRLLADLVHLIERLIDEGVIVDRYEATLEYRAGRWVAVDDPRWWMPTFG